MDFDPTNAKLVRPSKGFSFDPTGAKPVTPPTSRSAGEVAKDTGVGVVQGGANFAMDLGQAANLLTGGTLDRYVVRPAQRALDRAVGGEGNAPGIAGAEGESNRRLDQEKSPLLRRKQQELSETKGILPSIKKVITDPTLLGQFAAEQVPMIATLGAGTAGTGAKAIAAGAGEIGAKHAAERSLIAANAALGGGASANAAQQDVQAMPEGAIEATPEYRDRIAAGESPEDARAAVENKAGLKAGAVAAPLSALAGKITAPLEADIFRRALTRPGGAGVLSAAGAKQLASGVGKEAAEEFIQEGSEQVGQNLGAQTVDPSRPLMQGVPEAAGIGATVGGVLGGGITGAGMVLSRPSQQPTAQPAPQPNAAPAAQQPTATPPASPAGTVAAPQGAAPLDPAQVAATAAVLADPANGLNLTPEQADAEARAALSRQLELSPLDLAKERANQPALPKPDGTLYVDAQGNAGVPLVAPVPGAQAERMPVRELTRAPRPLPFPDAPVGSLGDAANAAAVAPLLQRNIAPAPGSIADAASVAPIIDKVDAEAAPETAALKEVADAVAPTNQAESPGNESDAAVAAAASSLNTNEGERGDGASGETAQVAATDDQGAAASGPVAQGESAAGADISGSDAAPVPQGDASVRTPRGEGAVPRIDGAATDQLPGGASAREAVAEAPTGVAGADDRGVDRAEAAVDPAASVIDDAAHTAATSPRNELAEPTDAQKEVGNYQKGHDTETVPGHHVSIENPAGSKRRPEWPTLQSHYGYLRGTRGRDKDHIDIFIKSGTPRAYRGNVFVVDQIDPKTGKFDEHKVMYGYANAQDARAGYLANYTPGWRGAGNVTEMPFSVWDRWVRDKGATRLPVAGSRYAKVAAKQLEKARMEQQSAPDTNTAAAAAGEPAPQSAPANQESSNVEEQSTVEGSADEAGQDGTGWQEGLLIEDAAAAAEPAAAAAPEESPAEPAPAAPAQPERRQDTATRAKIDALPKEQQSAEIEKLRGEKAALEKELRTSEKTGLPNRRAITETYEANPTWRVGAADMDGLGRVNDLFGHEAGDAILRAMGAALQPLLSDQVVIAHLNGDELATATHPDVDAESLHQKMQALLEEVTVRFTSATGQEYDYAGIGLTTGLADAKPYADFKAAYTDADAAAIRSKGEREAAGLRESKHQPGPPRRLREVNPARGEDREGDGAASRPESDGAELQPATDSAGAEGRVEPDALPGAPARRRVVVPADQQAKLDEMRIPVEVTKDGATVAGSAIAARVLARAQKRLDALHSLRECVAR